MNPNDARIRRVYTMEQNGTIVDDSLKAANVNELVIEWEAGSVFNGLGVNLNLIVVTRDISNNANLAAPLTQTIQVQTNSAQANTAYRQVIVIPANTLTVNVMYETMASLVRANAEIHSFSDWWTFGAI